MEIQEVQEIYDTTTGVLKYYIVNNSKIVKPGSNEGDKIKAWAATHNVKANVGTEIRNKAKFKQARKELLENLVVEYMGVEYQADEVSQGRMARAITAMGDEDTIEWVAKDNSVKVLSKVELKELLRLCGVEQTKLWIQR